MGVDDGRSGNVTRREYHRAYYARNAERIRIQHQKRQQIRHWTRWLLESLRTDWPPEPAVIDPTDRLQPIRRPTLRLPRQGQKSTQFAPNSVRALESQPGV